jgi:methyl-accepting chemotaxis protein
MSNSKKTILSVEESLQHIAIRLDEMTGNAMGTSYLHVTSQSSDSIDDVATQVSILSNQVEKLNEVVSGLSESLESIQQELTPLSLIGETLDNFLGWYIEFNKK